MLLKGVFKDSSIFIQLLIFLAILAVGLMVSAFASQLIIIFQFGFSREAMNQIMQNIINYPDILRTMQFFQVIGVFIFPAIICAWLFSNDYRSYLYANTPITIPVIILTIFSIIILIPFITWTQDLNQKMVFPEWLRGLEEWMLTQEEVNNQLIEKMLYAETIWVLIFNIIIVCVLTGIGEEFIFRGILQNIFGKVIKNPHLVIWTVAIIFSAIHLQFYGFIPRLLLGAYFGYLLFYTKNIWIPALAHFTNNLISVIGFYIYQDSPHMSKELDTLGTGDTWWMALISLALFLFLFTQIKRQGLNLQRSSS
ncbi:MAG: CPBP family intramembrane metalloprotease [Bacteroidales bacterium]|nr:CPBP family intramembrane metalloprotease [Bacteroidales bacterium]